MASHNLPSREEYIANHVTVIDTCNICLQPFDTEHIPARLSGTNSCHHVFGSTCIKKWLTTTNDNANKCPTCRTRLYYLIEGFDGDDRDYFDNHRQRSNIIVGSFGSPPDLKTAYTLTELIIDSFDQPSDHSQVHIRTCIEDALQNMAQQDNILIAVEEEGMWPMIIGAVRMILDEWSGISLFQHPPLLRCVQIMVNEPQWRFLEDFDGFVHDLCHAVLDNESMPIRTDAFLVQCVIQATNSQSPQLIVQDPSWDRIIGALKTVTDMYTADQFTLDRCIYHLGVALGWPARHR